MKQLFLSFLLLSFTTLACAEDAQQADSPAAEESTPVDVVISTSKGDIHLELYPDKAPKTVENFIKYADEGFYAGTIFHRVINGFMIQGGGFNTDFEKKKNHLPIKNEAANGLKNLRGTIAMARTAEPHSATSQFFINHKDNDSLDYPGHDGWGYCVFGKVTGGMDVVDAIAKTPTGSHKFIRRDVPKETIEIKKVTVVK
ncbi:MAG: peptidylprolyl isomerase [Pseudomonadota bacterium]